MPVALTPASSAGVFSVYGNRGDRYYLLGNQGINVALLTNCDGRLGA
jgi:hypothetical protein